MLKKIINIHHTLAGVVFVALFAGLATVVAKLDFMQPLMLSPLIIGVLFGMLYGNLLYDSIPTQWHSGLVFCSKRLLRLAIVLYGFRITFQQIAEIGLSGIFATLTILFSTLALGLLLGRYVLRMDTHTTVLTTMGSSICGAAAVLATEPVVRAKPYEATVAVATVVVFGVLAMFLYPFIYKLGWLGFDDWAYGIYAGSTIHEVAQVVAAGNAVSPNAEATAVIVKMGRVFMLAPLLLVLGFWISWRASQSKLEVGEGYKIPIPWFAFGFIVCAGVNSLSIFSEQIVSLITLIDTFLLTMAMSALGMETRFKQLKAIGLRPFYLALLLFAWLSIGGYFIVRIFIGMVN